MLDRILNSAKAIAPVALVGVFAILEEFGVSINVDWDLLGQSVAAGVLVWFTPNKELG